ncbi:MAG: hypothetical protein JXM73_07050 [Anaerolineae bacterium]|nr:hypothetical protein [Anaerolineae bacterium]
MQSPYVEALSLHLANRHDKFRQALLAARDQNIVIINAAVTVGRAEAGATIQAIESLTIRGISARAAFDRWVRRPLDFLCQPDLDQKIVVLVDGLDEALGYDPDNDLVSLLRRILTGDEKTGVDLPSQVHFLLTCRSQESRVLDGLPGRRLDLITDVPEGTDDPQDYAYERLHSLPDPRRRELARMLADKSQGTFLYVRVVLDDLLKSPEDLPSLEKQDLPDTLERAYHQYLAREVGADTTRWENQFRPMLGVLIVAHGPGLTRVQARGAAGLSRPAGDDVLRRCAQFLVGPRPEGPFRLFHESFRDYLRSGEDETFQVYPGTMNKQVAHFFMAEYGSGWGGCSDEYALRFTPTHLLEAARLAETNQERRQRASELQQLLTGNYSFRQRKIDHFGSPTPWLADLSAALALAADTTEVVQAWQYIYNYHRVVGEERQPRRVLDLVRAGKYGAALDRTALYSTMPNSQGLMRLWIAWVAAGEGQRDFATEAAMQALQQLPPRGIISESLQQFDPGAEEQAADARAEELRRLLVRLAWTVHPSEEDQKGWLQRVAQTWPADEVAAVAQRLTEPLSDWGTMFGDAGAIDDFVLLLAQLGAFPGADAAGLRVGEQAFYFQRQLAANLYHTRQDAGWWPNLHQAVNALAMDDYPSYREMALAWIGTAVLADESEARAREAMGKVLEGALGVPEPFFRGDAVVAALEGLARERGARLETEGLAEALETSDAVGSTKSTTETEIRLRANLPADPWAYEMRRQNSVAGALYRLDGPSRALAENMLRAAGAVGPEGSYAGYRVLSRLTLACRWLEWDRLDEARAEVGRAGSDAGHMLDQALGQERGELVEDMERWLAAWEAQSPDLLDREKALASAQDLTGMARSLRIQFLAALWAGEPEWLVRLVQPALDDATALDAVLGRLLGALAQVPQPDRPFERLVSEMWAEHLAYRFVVSV